MLHVTEALIHIQNMAAHLLEKRWAISSGGNISIRLLPIDASNELSRHFPHKKIFLNKNPFQSLTNSPLIITASGSSMEKIASDPLKHTVVCTFNQETITVYSFSEDLLPSSEWKSHFAIQAYLQGQKKENSIVLHAHVPLLIAFSHLKAVRKLNSQKVNRILYSMLPELLIHLPEGIGLVPFYMPGSDELAQASVKVLKNTSFALWINHGIVAHGREPSNLIEKISLIETAILIYQQSRLFTSPSFLQNKTIKQLLKAFTSYPLS